VIFGGHGEEVPQADAAQAEESRKETNRYRMKNDPINRLYAKARWTKFRAVMLARNPICQRILKNPFNGEPEQCHAPAVIVHHRVSPRVREDLFLVPSNMACFCRNCHPDTEGDPQGWRVGVDFVATVVPQWTVG
jgi:hypothetical protein